MRHTVEAERVFAKLRWGATSDFSTSLRREECELILDALADQGGSTAFERATEQADRAIEMAQTATVGWQAERDALLGLRCELDLRLSIHEAHATLAAADGAPQPIVAELIDDIRRLLDDGARP